MDIKRGVFHRDSSSLLLFVIILLPLTLLVRQIKAGYRLQKNTISINHHLFMDDIKYVAN